MRAHSMAARLVAGLIGGVVGSFAPAAHAEGGESILQKTRDAYARMNSYADTGKVLIEYGASSEDKHTFATVFNRSPRHFVVDFRKEGGDRYVVWADPDAFHTWWKTTGQQTDYPNPNNAPAIGLSGQNTAQVALKIPTLLYARTFSAAMLNIADPALDGSEEIGGRHCHRITGRASDVYSATGKEVNIRKVTVWIDTDSFLVRKMVEEWKALPGQRNRTTTSYEPRPNPTLSDAQFKFTPPAQ